MCAHPRSRPTFNDVIASLGANLQLINFLDICIYHECMQAVFISSEKSHEEPVFISSGVCLFQLFIFEDKDNLLYIFMTVRSQDS